jgi:glycosyltransferase 2 family protein
MTARRLLPIALRAACAIGLVGLLMYGIDWQGLPDRFAGLSWPPALLAILGLGLHFLVSPWKWQQALRLHDLHFPLHYLFRANGTGFFLNNFLPSGLGGDAYRVVATLPASGERSRAISAVIIERLVGFATLISVGALGAVLLLPRYSIAGVFLLVSGLGGLLGLLGLYAIAAGWAKALTNRIRHTRFFAAVTCNVRYLKGGARHWAALIGISLLFHAIAVANVYFLFQSLGIEVSLEACALVSAVAGLSAVVPLSINGIGIVEGSFAGAAVALDIPYEPALAVAILIRLLVLPPSLLFGLAYVLRGNPASESAAGRTA